MMVVKNKHGRPSIDGMYCSYQTKKIRGFIQMLFEVNKEFILPKKYTYVVTKLNGFAKIIKSPKR